MGTKNIIAIGILIVAVILGAILIALPNPDDPGPFTSEFVKVQLPRPGATVLSSFQVSGEARGYWYFEASFPVEVLDENGNQIAITYAQAQSDWMTEEFVPFVSNVEIASDYSGPATLVLHKDNASGLPEHDDFVSFPIMVQ